MTNPSLIKDVLLIVDGDPPSFSAIDQGIAYAARHDACLTIIVASENVSLAAAAEPMGYAMALTVAEDLSAARLVAVRRHVKDAPVAVAIHGLLEAPDVLPRMAKIEGSYADIILIPGADRWRDDSLRRHLTETLLFTGVPILVMPADWIPGPVNHAVLGWNASIESFRAARVLLTLVEADASVDVVVVDALDRYEPSQAVPGTHIARHLGRHGLRVEVHAIGSANRGVAGALQALASNHKADLLVVGGYGRSRALEFILGGVTRELIGQQHVPILFVH